jgi:prepilin-type N-terminal cleavage/methylation domain-containing protein
MTNATRRQWGFTLIELMVTIAVVLTFAILAVPSFQSLRQRSALRGAGDQMLSFWNQARLESAKRNSNVKFAVLSSGSTGAYCFGAATTASTTVTASCNCFIANACDVASFPATGQQADWNKVTLSGATIAGSDWPTVATITPVVIESKRTALTTAGGTITLNGPILGNKAYKLRLNIDTLGRGVLCEPTGAADKLSDYHNQRCSP